MAVESYDNLVRGLTCPKSAERRGRIQATYRAAPAALLAAFWSATAQ
jgi:hypothetical protein